MFSGSGTFASEFLGLAPSRVSHQHGSVISHQNFFDVTFRLFVHEFLIEGDDAFADGLANSVDLGSVTTTSYPDSDIKLGKTLGS